MEKYFLLSWKDVKGALSSAFAPSGVKTDHELIHELNGNTELPFNLELFKLSDDKNGIIKSNDLTSLKEIWLDYQPNNLAWPLMSEKLKTTIEKYLTGNEGLDWISVKVTGNGEQRVYYIPRFENMLDVLDTEKTMFVQGTDRIIRPCFSLMKINKYAVFHQPSSHNLWKITSSLYFNELLKKGIQKEKLTGMDFEKTLAV